MTIDVPPQTRSQKHRINALWALMVVVMFSPLVFWRPYALGTQSPILTKAEIHQCIVDFRKQAGKWPKTETEPLFRFGPHALAERSMPSFVFRGAKTEKNLELAEYSMTFRGQTTEETVSYDPLAKPKRRLF